MSCCLSVEATRDQMVSSAFEGDDAIVPGKDQQQRHIDLVQGAARVAHQRVQFGHGARGKEFVIGVLGQRDRVV